jgi:hypothetical protein
MESFATTTDAVRKYVVSGTLDRVDWNAELLGGDLEVAVRALKRQSGKGLIDEYEFVATPAGGPRTDVDGRPVEARRLEAGEPAGVRLGGGGDALRAEKSGRRSCGDRRLSRPASPPKARATIPARRFPEPCATARAVDSAA